MTLGRVGHTRDVMCGLLGARGVCASVGACVCVLVISDAIKTSTRHPRGATAAVVVVVVVVGVGWRWARRKRRTRARPGRQPDEDGPADAGPRRTRACSAAPWGSFPRRSESGGGWRRRDMHRAQPAHTGRVRARHRWRRVQRAALRVHRGRLAPTPSPGPAARARRGTPHGTPRHATQAASARAAHGATLPCQGLRQPPACLRGACTLSAPAAPASSQLRCPGGPLPTAAVSCQQPPPPVSVPIPDLAPILVPASASVSAAAALALFRTTTPHILLPLTSSRCRLPAMRPLPRFRRRSRDADADFSTPPAPFQGAFPLAVLQGPQHDPTLGPSDEHLEHVRSADAEYSIATTIHSPPTPVHTAQLPPSAAAQETLPPMTITAQSYHGANASLPSVPAPPPPHGPLSPHSTGQMARDEYYEKTATMFDTIPEHDEGDAALWRTPTNVSGRVKSMSMTLEPPNYNYAESDKRSIEGDDAWLSLPHLHGSVAGHGHAADATPPRPYDLERGAAEAGPSNAAAAAPLGDAWEDSVDRFAGPKRDYGDLTNIDSPTRSKFFREDGLRVGIQQRQYVLPFSRLPGASRAVSSRPRESTPRATPL